MLPPLGLVRKCLRDVPKRRSSYWLWFNLTLLCTFPLYSLLASRRGKMASVSDEGQPAGLSLTKFFFTRT